MNKSGLFTLAVCVCVAGTFASGAIAQNYKGSSGSSGNGAAAASFGKNVAQSQAESAVKSLIPYFGADQAEWLKRFEINWTFLDPGKSEQSILTVQPIYQSDNKKDTVFFQGSLLRYALYNDYRWTANLGAGYRRLLADNTVMIGANTFFDNEFTNGHRRASIGAEAKWNVLDFGANDYFALSGDRDVSGYVERALSGRDFRIATQMPYIPWIKIGGGYFWWDKEYAAKDMNGSTFTADFALHPNFNLAYKWSSYDVNNNASRGQSSVMLNFTLARLSQPTLSTGPAISDKVFDKRDLSKETLNKVVRENRIIVERRTTGGSVIISRGN